jgi:hypothetical protein
MEKGKIIYKKIGKSLQSFKIAYPPLYTENMNSGVTMKPDYQTFGPEVWFSAY